MFTKAKKLKPALRAVVAGTVFVVLAGCATVYRNHGYVPTDDELAEIVVGVDTRDSVAETLGSPSATGALKDTAYYYVASRMRYFGATEPKEVSREVVQITFDDKGVVTNVRQLSLEDGQIVRLNQRVTSSSVKDKTFLRQLLGNLGRFNPNAVLE